MPFHETTLRRFARLPIRILGRARLTAYARYYNETRTHLALNKDAPFGRLTQQAGTITGGLTWVVFTTRSLESNLWIELAVRHQANRVLIEDAGPGMNLLQDLYMEMPPGVTRPIGLKPEGSKQDRVAAQSAKIEAGQVHLPRDAPWLHDFLNELLGFPNARHDDQVDSVSQFLCWVQQDMRLNRVMMVAPIIVYGTPG